MNKIKKVWGHEEIICSTAKYSGKILVLKKDYQSSFHHHKIKDEVLYILEGKVLFWLNKNAYILRPKDAIRVRPYVNHSFRGLKDSKIIEFATQDIKSDTYRIIKSRKVRKNK